MESFKKMSKMKTDMPCYAKGGSVAKKADGGVMSPMDAMNIKRAAKRAVGMRGNVAPAKMPAMPRAADASMAGMPARAMPNARPTGLMKKGGKVEGESKKEHYSEMKKMGKLDKEIRNESEEIGRVKARLTKHEDMAASKAHKGLKAGGKACYAKGGSVSEYANTKVVEAKKHTKAGTTGGVKGYNTGGVVGYKTGGVAEPGFKRGGRCAK